MPMFRITNLVDRTLSLEFEDTSPEAAIETYVEGQDPTYYSVPEYQSLRENLLVEQIG